ncbi:hypothetical protein PG993_006715 [Apiospora rasikravindrae]|uniref:Uncharacterized protein n=1 Tax=Apiospora rasikravindrae TaxID=990691 RepID=A0ABR1T6I2_9PEZI
MNSSSSSSPVSGNDDPSRAFGGPLSVLGTDPGLATFFLGFTVAAAAFTFFQGIKQTRGVWSRSKNLDRSPYIIMLWLEWTADGAMAIITYLHITGVIPGSAPLGIPSSPGPSPFLLPAPTESVASFLALIQCIMGILVNRVSLLMYDPRTSRRLKWSVVALLGVINLSGFFIFIPSQLGVNATWVYADAIWDRLEKTIFAALDLSLNLYFIHLVRSNLIENGLLKYKLLYWVNLVMVFVSISLDVILIGLISKGFVFVQFHPICYLIKLNIEMNMADLIAKIAKASRKRLGVAGIHTSQVRMTPRMAAAKESSLGFSGGTSTTSGARSSRHRPLETGSDSATVAAGLERSLESNPAPFENNLKDVRFVDAGGLLVDCDDTPQSTGAEKEPGERKLEGKKPAAPTTGTVAISPDQGTSRDVQCISAEGKRTD